MTCVITGCSLVSHQGQVWGDLHQIGTSFVFNAVLTEKGEAAWEFPIIAANPLTRVIDTRDSREYFERRGVICFSKQGTEFSVSALEYLG